MSAGAQGAPGGGSRIRSISSRTAANITISVGAWSGGAPVPGYRSGCSSEPSRSVTILTTLVGASGSAGVDIADAAENGVTAVLAVSIGAVAKEYVVAVSAAPGVLSFWNVVSPRWVAVLTADATSPMVSARERVCAPFEVFDAFRSAKSPLTESRVLSSSCAPAEASASVFEVSASLGGGGGSSPVVALAVPASSESSAVVLPSPLPPVDPAAERDADFLSEADESASSPAAKAGRLTTEVFFVEEDLPEVFFVEEDLPVDEGVPVDEDVVVDEESPVGDEPDVSAYAVPGVVAMATPTPRVTASAPTRPMCLA